MAEVIEPDAERIAAGVLDETNERRCRREGPPDRAAVARGHPRPVRPCRSSTGTSNGPTPSPRSCSPTTPPDREDA